MAIAFARSLASGVDAARASARRQVPGFATAAAAGRRYWADGCDAGGSGPAGTSFRGRAMHEGMMPTGGLAARGALLQAGRRSHLPMLAFPRGAHGTADEENKVWSDVEDALAGLVTKRHREKLQDDTLTAMRRYLATLGLDVSKLSVVHVAGTKGKGSTTTMVESMLRSKGYKTGLFTSPHLVDVRERIRINGQVLPIADFSSHFWRVHGALSMSGEPMPGYFRFLTCLAFEVFCKSKLDVVVLEVGLGGRLDATNIVPNPVVCGVTSLGLDHQNVLGDTIEEIAREKAGIFKPGVLAVTSNQPPTAMLELEMHAKKSGNSLVVAPDLASFEGASGQGDIRIGVPGEVQRMNAAVAVSLANAWLTLKDGGGGGGTIGAERLFVLHQWMRKGLADAHILGRCQTVRFPPPQKAEEDVALGGGGCTLGPSGGLGEMVWYLDGAHTIESMDNGVEWFRTVGKFRPGARRVLVFYCSSERDPDTLLDPIQALHAEQPFGAVAVCANQMPIIPQGTTSEGWLRKLAGCLERRGAPPVQLFGSVPDLLDWLEGERAASGAGGVSAYITGSLLLCGDLLRESVARGQRPMF